MEKEDIKINPNENSSSNETPGAISEKKQKIQRYPKCALCKNHFRDVILRGHKHKCEYQSCACSKCDLVRERRTIMASQQRTRRDMNYNQRERPRQEEMMRLRLSDNFTGMFGCETCKEEFPKAHELLEHIQTKHTPIYNTFPNDHSEKPVSERRSIQDRTEDNFNVPIKKRKLVMSANTSLNERKCRIPMAGTSSSDLDESANSPDTYGMHSSSSQGNMNCSIPRLSPVFMQERSGYRFDSEANTNSYDFSSQMATTINPSIGKFSAIVCLDVVSNSIPRMMHVDNDRYREEPSHPVYPSHDTTGDPIYPNKTQDFTKNGLPFRKQFDESMNNDNFYCGVAMNGITMNGLQMNGLAMNGVISQNGSHSEDGLYSKAVSICHENNSSSDNNIIVKNKKFKRFWE